MALPHHQSSTGADLKQERYVLVEYSTNIRTQACLAVLSIRQAFQLRRIWLYYLMYGEGLYSTYIERRFVTVKSYRIIVAFSPN